MLSDFPSAEQVAEAVQAYNRKFGDEDKNLWALSQKTSQELQSSTSLVPIENFVWSVKKWGRIQGAWTSDKTAMARALVDLNIPSTRAHDLIDGGYETYIQLWTKLVTSTRVYGAKYRHFSWASKSLHWLLPDQVPIYDAFVRCYLGEGNKEGEPAYRTIVKWEYEVARRLAPVRDEIVGDIEPRTLLRAIDKFLWWESGGKDSKTGVIKQWI